MPLLQEFVCRASLTLCNTELFFFRLQQSNFAQLMQQVYVFCHILPSLIDPRQHLINIFLLDALHEFAAVAREVMTVHV